MQRIVIDTDGGVDDALAILLALSWPDVSIEAITTVHGNVPLETATGNVLEVLYIAGRGAAVSMGCAAPLHAAPFFGADVHGSDGLGGWIRHAPVTSLPGAPRAAQTINDLARRFPGEITLVTIGPLTNAELAFREDPEAFAMLRRIVVMGGAVRERGNVTTAAEFNIYVDPHAARKVFHAGVPLTLVGLDVTHRAVFTRELLDTALGTRFDTRARFLRCICERLFSFYAPLMRREMFFLHDPLAIGVALDPSFVVTEAMSLDVETDGELTRGMTVPERRPWIRKPPNADVCVDVDAERFLDLFSRNVIAG